MPRKLTGYFLLSFLSFCVFTGVFHAVAHAQTTTPIATPLAQSDSDPTPTIYEDEPRVLATAQTSQQQPLPTPTVYSAPQEEAIQKPLAQIAQETKTPQPTPTTPAPTATPLPTAVPTTPPPPPAIAGPADLEGLFDKYSSEYGVNKDDLKGIAKCESGFNPTSNNSGMYLGMFQFSHGTWVANRNRMGMDPNPELRFNAEESIRTAAFVISRGGRGAWPNC